MTTLGTGLLGYGTLGSPGLPVFSLPERHFGIPSTTGGMYRFLLTTRDLVPFGEFTQATSRTINLALNRPGSASFSLPITDELSEMIVPLNTALMVLREGVPIYSGPIWTIEESLPEERVSVTSVGWFEELNKRILRNPTVQFNTDAGAIAQALITQAFLDEPSNFPVSSFGTLVPTQTRIRKYERFANIGAEIQALSEVESGYDWSIDPGDKSISFHQRIGSQQNVMFMYGDTGGNLQSVTRQIDGASMANRMNAVGKFATRVYQDTGSVNFYGLHEEQQSLSDVPNTDILDAYAQAEVIYRGYPRITFQMTPFPSNGENAIPRPFIDYNIGDEVFLTAKRGRMQIDKQDIRIFGFTIGIDENDVERVSNIQTTASGG